jgi:hypothetical protein
MWRQSERRLHKSQKYFEVDHKNNSEKYIAYYYSLTMVYQAACSNLSLFNPLKFDPDQNTFFGIVFHLIIIKII